MSEGKFEAISEPPETLTKLERKSWKTVLLRANLEIEMYRLAAQAYIETENHRPAYESVSASPTLPRWFSNQLITDSLLGHANFHFL